jgi:hypothetical protein
MAREGEANMYHFGESIYEAELRLQEAARAVEAHQARARIPSSRGRRRMALRDAYHRQMAALGRRLSALGCALEARALAGRQAGGS